MEDKQKKEDTSFFKLSLIRDEKGEGVDMVFDCEAEGSDLMLMLMAFFSQAPEMMLPFANAMKIMAQMKIEEELGKLDNLTKKDFNDGMI